MTGMMIVSGCDAAVAVAETVAPTEADFVAKMNEKAAALGVLLIRTLPILTDFPTRTITRRLATWLLSLPMA